MPGMSAHEHAHMDGMPGMSHDAAGSGDHPVGLVLGGFAALWAAVLIYASLLRRRPAARKRRATLARVRAAAGEPTVPSAPEARS
jgi:hypothetical protein